MTGVDEAVQSGLAASPVVTAVFDSILSDVHEGRLQPGQRISDAALAEQLGVSRTPVREALLRLREIGIVEASANRFTRIAEVTPQQTAEAMVVWVSLYAAVVAETVPTASGAVLAAMRADHEHFLDAVQRGDLQGIARWNLSFFSHLAAASTNQTLQRAITSVVHIVRLGSMHLPERIDLPALVEAQRQLLGAVIDHDPGAARRAIGLVGDIEVPQLSEGFPGPGS
ncbi:MAG: GntR family transcriptional regulator [Rhodoglobus sp.]